LAVVWAHRRTYDARWQFSPVGPDKYSLLQVPDPRGNGELLPVWNLDPKSLGLQGVSNVAQTSTINTPTIFSGFGATLNMRFGRGGSLLTGFDSGRINSNTCQFNDPNAVSGNTSSRFCDTTKYGEPFRTQYKISGSYPLPYGVSIGAVFQSVPGAEHIETYVLSKAAFPQLVQPSITIPLNVPGSLFYPRLEQLDLKFSKTLRVRAIRITPQLDIFNATNTATVLTTVNSYGPTLGNVSSILNPRFVRFGITTRF
jgi:hypothetical protein